MVVFFDAMLAIKLKEFVLENLGLLIKHGFKAEVLTVVLILLCC